MDSADGADGRGAAIAAAAAEERGGAEAGASCLCRKSAIVETVGSGARAVATEVRSGIIRPLALPFEVVAGGVHRTSFDAVVKMLPGIIKGMEPVLRARISARLRGFRSGHDDPSALLPPPLRERLELDLSLQEGLDDPFDVLDISLKQISRAVPERADGEAEGEVSKVSVVAAVDAAIVLHRTALSVGVRARREGLSGLIGAAVASVSVEPGHLRLSSEQVRLMCGLHAPALS